MPDTYTKEQIAAHVDNLHEGEFPCDCGYVWTVKESCAPKTITCPMCGRVHKNPILSALSTAEQERDALAARCAELEARMQGAADNAEEWDRIKALYRKEWSIRKSSCHKKNQYHGHGHDKDGLWDGDNGLLAGCECAACALHRAAILGEKKE